MIPVNPEMLADLFDANAIRGMPRPKLQKDQLRHGLHISSDARAGGTSGVSVNDKTPHLTSHDTTDDVRVPRAFQRLCGGRTLYQRGSTPGDLRTDTFQHRITFVTERLRYNKFHPNRKQQPICCRLAEQTQRPKLVSEVKL